MNKYKYCNLCGSELGNRSGGAFISDGKPHAIIPSGYYIIVCMECWASCLSQLYKISNEEIDEYLS